MKSVWASAIAKHLRACCLLAGALAAGTAWAATSNYIIETAPGTQIAPLAAKYQFSVVKTSNSRAETMYSVTTVAPLSPYALKSLASEPGVHEVETNSTVDSAETGPSSKARQALQSLGSLLSTRTTVQYYGNPVLSTYVNQPGAEMIQLSPALASYGKGWGTVAIIDTGVDPQHPALRGALLPGYDFTRNRPDTVSELYDLPTPLAIALQQSTVELLDAKKYVLALQQSTVEILDQSTVELLDGKGLPFAFGHGTMVAGLVHLVAPGARIMPLKAFRADGSADIFDIASAIRYAVDNGANVISMSFSYDTPSPVLSGAIDYAKSRGVLCVASAGNAGKKTVMYPAGYSYVVGVGSVNFSDRRSPFSNYGSSASTSAPGEALVTLFPGGNYAAVWGTSFSSALVAGSAILMKSLRPGMGYSDFKDALDAGIEIEQGMGDARLALLKSFRYLQKH